MVPRLGRSLGQILVGGQEDHPVVVVLVAADAAVDGVLVRPVRVAPVVEEHTTVAVAGRVGGVVVVETVHDVVRRAGPLAPVRARPRLP